LFSLFCKGLLPERFAVVGFSRTEWSDDDFREQMREGMKELAPEMLNEEKWPDFAPHLHYLPGNATRNGRLRIAAILSEELEGRGQSPLLPLPPPAFLSQL
jgi:glucose-6-phosphate 1-dehydrogenase